MNQQNSSNDTCAIDLLSNECLIHIFSFLSVIDRIRIERVSKRWREASRKSWKTVHCINIRKHFWGVDDVKNKILINQSILRRMLRRCGPFITQVDLTREYDDPPYSLPTLVVRLQSCIKVFKIIHEMCQNVVSINVGLPCTESTIEYIAENFHDLQDFAIIFYGNEFAQATAKLFSNCMKLKSVTFMNGSYSGKVLFNLNSDSVEELNFEEISIDSEDHFAEALERLSNLQKLSIHYIFDYRSERLSNFVLKGICFNKEKLKELKLHIKSNPNEFTDYSCIKHLINLEKLDIRNTGFADDDVLKIFADSCTKLREIIISSSEFVTDKGIAYLFNLPNLRCLFLQSLNKITDKVLGDALNLKELLCFDCPNINEEGIAQLIYKSRCIETITLSGCKLKSAKYLQNLAAYSALSKLKVNIYSHGWGW